MNRNPTARVSDCSPYATTYSESYQRPNTTMGFTAPMSGFAVNNQLSPFALEPDADPTAYITTTHLQHSDASSVQSLRSPGPIARAAMERSGFWHDSHPNSLCDSPARRTDAQREREANASHLDPITKRRIQHANAIEAENGCSGPKWGSTTTRTTFTEPETPAGRFQKLDRDLIGPRDPTAFARDHVTVPEGSVCEQISTKQASYPRHPIGREIHFPNRTVMERSGFAAAAVPTRTEAAVLSAVAPENLPPAAVAQLRRKNTTEYQNLYEPDPYRSVQQISYRNPGDGLTPVERAIAPGGRISRAATGYGANTKMVVGPPGDPRKEGVEQSVMKSHYRHPDDVREPQSELMPNLVEHSGYWSVG